MPAYVILSIGWTIVLVCYFVKYARLNSEIIDENTALRDKIWRMRHPLSGEGLYEVMARVEARQYPKNAEPPGLVKFAGPDQEVAELEKQVQDARARNEKVRAEKEAARIREEKIGKLHAEIKRLDDEFNEI